MEELLRSARATAQEELGFSSPRAAAAGLSRRVPRCRAPLPGAQSCTPRTARSAGRLGSPPSTPHWTATTFDLSEVWSKEASALGDWSSIFTSARRREAVRAPEWAPLQLEPALGPPRGNCRAGTTKPALAPALRRAPHCEATANAYFGKELVLKQAKLLDVTAATRPAQQTAPCVPPAALGRWQQTAGKIWV